MYAFIKNRLTFATTAKLTVLDMSITESDSGDTSTMMVPSAQVGYDNRGDWVFVDGVLLRIDEVEPDEETTALKLSDFASAFDRPVIASTAASTEAYVASLLEDIAEDTDEMYSMPYLSISTSGSTAYIPPITDDSGLFQLADYLRTLAAVYNIRLDYTVSGDTLAITVTEISPTDRVVIIGRKNQLVTAPVFSGAATAKIIVLPSGTAYYLNTDGTFSTSPSGARAYGSIKAIDMSDKTSAEILAAVAEEFANGMGDHKIEWLSFDDIAVGDPCVFRINGAVYRGTVAAKTRTLNDERYQYTSGQLATTLTDKLKEARK